EITNITKKKYVILTVFFLLNVNKISDFFHLSRKLKSFELANLVLFYNGQIALFRKLIFPRNLYELFELFVSLNFFLFLFICSSRFFSFV
ncbi:hypothetical protein L9F63_020648, partial [Diploptera punctata]